MVISTNSRLVLALALLGSATVCFGQQDGMLRVPPPRPPGMQMQSQNQSAPQPPAKTTNVAPNSAAPNQTPAAASPSSGATTATTADTKPAVPKAQKAKITLTAKGLMVDANNSSLAQILREITAQTGMTVDGLGKDQRIYGVYGPAKVTVVLGNLLVGTGYNVMMLGSLQNGAPKALMLSSRDPNAKKSDEKAVAATNDDDDIAGVDNTPPDDGSHPPQMPNQMPPQNPGVNQPPNR